MIDWILQHGSTVLIVAGPAFSAYASFIAERRAAGRQELRKKGLWPMLILMGAVTGLVGSLWAGFQQDRVSDYLSGGESYGYLVPGVITSTSIDYLFIEVGDTPLYDVLIEIHDQTKFEKLWLEKGLPAPAIDPNSSEVTMVPTDDLMQVQRQTTVSLTIGNVPPMNARSIWQAPPPETEDQRYAVSIFARNGVISEQLLMHRTASGWTWAVKAWRTPVQVKNGKNWKIPLYEMVMDDFPREKVKWR